MAYHIYTTDAIVCGSKASMTSDKSYLLFTREAGMLWASARSVREEKSKQRYALQDFSIIRVSLLKGKGGWRIGSVAAERNAFMAAQDRIGRTGVTYLTKLLRRYVHGEQSLPAVYDDIDTCLEYLVTATNRDEAAALLQVATLRLLHHLGYVVHSSLLSSFLSPVDITQALTCYTPAHDTQFDRLIAEAAAVSHL